MAGTMGWTLAAVIAALAGEAAAAPVCTLPPRIEPAPERPAPRSEIERDVPTAYYMLALTWSPEWCRTRRDSRADRLQCGDNRFGFTLHGLWPNGAGRTHPRFCGPAPALDPATVRRHLCAMPSAELMQHEWAAHGTCGWSSGAAYLDRAGQLWSGLRMPAIDRAETAGDVRDAFARANPGVPRGGVFVGLDNRQRLTEVRVCYDLRFRASRCPRSFGAPDRLPVRVTPMGG